VLVGPSKTFLEAYISYLPTSRQGREFVDRAFFVDIPHKTGFLEEVEI
jgi:hypothetical protein